MATAPKGQVSMARGLRGRVVQGPGGKAGGDGLLDFAIPHFRENAAK